MLNSFNHFKHMHFQITFIFNWTLYPSSELASVIVSIDFSHFSLGGIFEAVRSGGGTCGSSRKNIRTFDHVYKTTKSRNE